MIYFASDFHLGAPNHKESRIREDKIIRWLNAIEHDADTIFLLGDLFDFWHEYKTVVPKGFTRFFGKLAELSDKGIHIEVFTGNHDLWMSGYFEQELNISVLKEPEERTLLGKRFFIGHGDGLGPGDKTYKSLRSIFHHPFFQTLFCWLHPDIGISIANAWSKKSRSKHTEPEVFHGKDKEWLYIFSKEYLETKNSDIDFFIFGHRHLPLDLQIEETKSRYFNLGEWISQFQYAKFDGNTLELLKFEETI